MHAKSGYYSTRTSKTEIEDGGGNRTPMVYLYTAVLYQTGIIRYLCDKRNKRYNNGETERTLRCSY